MSTTGYSRSPRLLKGALIYFGAPMLIPIPNIIVFQYNPESMTRTLTPFQPSPQLTVEGRVANQSGQGKGASLSQPCDPQESFSLALELDATDALEHPDSHPLAMVSGIADRLAAIEMLMYPPEEGGGLLGGMATISVSAGGLSLVGGAGGADTTPKRVPIVLFFWGPGRIVPVQVTTLSIEEQQYSPTLYPLRAKANIGLNVLSLEELKALEGDPSSAAALEIAKGCYSFTRTQKKVLATANLANSAESIIGMLPI